MTRIRIGLIAILCLCVLAIGLVLTRPALLSERTIRITLEEQLAAWTGAKISVAGSAKTRYFPRLQMDIHRVRMSDITRLEMLKDIEADRVSIRLGLLSLLTATPVVDRITLVNPRITARLAREQEGSEAKTAQAPVIMKALAENPFEEIVIENGEMTLTGPETKESFENITAKFEVLGTGGAHAMRSGFKWRDHEVVIRYETGRPQQQENHTAMPLEVSVGGDLVSASIKGNALIRESVEIDGNIDLGIPNLAKFTRWMGVLVPDNLKFGEFSANGPFHWKGDRIAFDEGTYVLDGNRALGALALSYGGPRPEIDGTIALQRLNLGRYFQTVKPAPESESDKKVDKAASVDVDFPLLHHLNIDLRISTTELSAKPFVVGQSALSLALKSGHLMGDIAIFDLCGGSGNARVEFDATVPDAEMRLTTSLSGIDSKTCLEFFVSDSPVRGKAELIADITTQGRTAADLLQKLGGKARITITEGEVDLDIAKAISTVRKEPHSGWDKLSGTTEFEKFDGSFIFRQGSVYGDSLKLDLGTTVLMGEGTVDYTKRNLDMRMKVLAEQPKKEGEKKIELKPTLPGEIAMKGPWANPSFSVLPVKSSMKKITPSFSLQALRQ